ncbi:MAG: hypothetical protein ACLR0U_16410 [Enterocloster clostridioformis]
MTTFSSRGIVRSDKTADIQEFVLPVQAYPQPEDDENRGEECIQPKPPAGDSYQRMVSGWCKGRELLTRVTRFWKG